jgi:hypothetical protein
VDVDPSRKRFLLTKQVVALHRLPLSIGLSSSVWWQEATTNAGQRRRHTAFRKIMLSFFRSHPQGQPLLLNDDGSSSGFREDEAFNNGAGIKLYDASVMLELPKSVCQGYVTLLTGGAPTAEQPVATRPPRQRIKDAKEAALPLAYASLASGNVIDACFGARPGSPTQARTFATTLTKEAKEKLDKVAEDDERVEKIAVEAYLEAFRTIIKMHDDIGKLNVITACFCTKKIRRKAADKLATDFSKLQDALKSK